MPKREDIQSVLLIGSGPIMIGQACEFDYSGVQAIRALKEEGIRVILVNSNPATVMTDPDLADATYIEPLTPGFLETIIQKEKPDALLPTMGGQTALNLAITLAERGILEKYGVEMIGASVEAISLGEDRLKFRDLMTDNGMDTCRGGFAHSMDEARTIQKDIGFPVIIRPSFTLGGSGGGVAHSLEEFESIAHAGLTASPNSQILVEESIIGWKEFELEVIRDKADNCIIVCSIENLDAMGVHTGDSITVAPAQTLTDREYQTLRDMSLKILRLVGVDTGGSNVQFAVDPKTSRVIVVEMNPRVSRSSALASKATGYPIAKVAAKLALGYTLDELANQITKITPASFEPSLDYVVIKFPRWAFEKFPRANATLTTQMKSVGEVMSLGRGFKEAFLKAVQSLEQGRHHLGIPRSEPPENLEKRLTVPNWLRMRSIFHALRAGWDVDRIYELTHIDPWFLTHFRDIVAIEQQLSEHRLDSLPEDLLRLAKFWGLSDAGIALLMGEEETTVRAKTSQLPYGYKAVDTCAGEFPCETPYLYGAAGEESEVEPLPGPKVVIIGSGPNRIGQGIEFDYCCVQAVNGFKKAGFKTIMVNCNPETVSTDFDVADRLYFEPLTLERVLSILNFEKPDAVAVAFGGQTSLNLAEPLSDLGFRIIGTSSEIIHRVEDREAFAQVIEATNLRQAENRTANDIEEANAFAKELGFPLMVRPSFVLGGRAMSIVWDQEELDHSLRLAMEATPNQPIFIDRFLDDAIELDVDAMADGKQVSIVGIMQHIEEAGIHSGDSSCVLPPVALSPTQITEIKRATRALAENLGVVGLLNVQYAIWRDELYVIEANPRCSRTVPFAAKAIGFPVAETAARVMAGATLEELNFPLEPEPYMWHVKSPVFPFNKLQGEDPVLGPEMKSTGEVMGSARSFGNAYAKAYRATNYELPREGKAFISVTDSDKQVIAQVARELYQLGFTIVATRGTAQFLRERGVPTEDIAKRHQGSPNIVDAIQGGEIALIINTPVGKESHEDDRYIRFEALRLNVPCITTTSAAMAVVAAIRAIKSERLTADSLQDLARDRA
ncbi:carbamoyl-phosphate synthase large subunit [Acanthopleuribacter pedis]|uniref:Carbamoyl phosphate synthase large chain n=1 Tax=Acanthopleuribacter pedis TaxID=442870 RepID=A0A8J7QAG4_9BACT|nr:carbamoyl-phosphate synthase large subunit [Acanthopleuribacter pedis]MBO1320454.1 carbamoyl-phosphate synthase large subunit [Acanthopleuribacter pedis]